MHKGPQNIEIVRAILSLGHSLNKLVIAEGIETVEELRQLQHLGVPVGQGYLLARPLRPVDVQKLLSAPGDASANWLRDESLRMVQTQDV
jgi:EAL domain-containing protein (putative c-di-GMP-specific phosphodiesterase class I)